ncbi:MAG TPA: DUF6144 family protein [Oscillospiraceae bacterium]|nr:DUF6144 family protein [Oscillospiraceae bacterium]HPF55606.1 DUF6144 family protein [Clostridiales bacterium]HPK34619.1 DUF6144 family protein [Oscillospiraceae bacterium]HPR74616.1 DUF6144 family protein [Oscillospiraceae bacterium]
MTGMQGIKIQNAIEKRLGKTAAKDFAAKFPLSKSADYLRKFKWAKDVCDYLNSTYTPEEVKAVRFACSCTPPEDKIEKIKRLYENAKDLDAFAEAFENEYHGTNLLWHEGETLFFGYPACYCSCVKRVNKMLPKTWCLCTVGYTKKIFDTVLGCETEVELIESIKTGSSRCVMKITRPL